MSFGASLAQLVEVLDAEPLNLAEPELAKIAMGITTDSRHVGAGELFLALRGEQFDGHTFVEAALQQGAIAAVVDRQSVTSGLGTDTEIPLLVAEDTLAAYQAIARWWREQFTISVIAVTGSVGKTTTKELIAAVLATQGRVLKTQANYNNEIGVPKTLLQLGQDHDYAVIEMGMRGSGEIALLTQIARPDIAVITNVGTAHIERLGSEQAIANAKCELLAEMPSTGIAILNHDNIRLLETAAQVWQGKTVTFGLEGGDVQGQLLDSQALQIGDVTFPLPLPGRHNALNYLAALAVAQVLQVSWSPLIQGLTLELPKGRAQRYNLPNDVVILDETYNAGVESMTAALHLLAQTPGQRHIAVLGTMKELGDRSVDLHHQVGTVVHQLHLDHLLILAEEAESEAMAAGAKTVPVEKFLSHAALLERLKSFVKPGDRLLFKASRAVGLDQVVDQLKSVTLTQQI
ncbi:UDP-N-acetylmuramoyl-tripeptide--D-alanyl-D-alanine ligase [Leptolyngbya sp. FACHB-541]|uniref:UDP-N-acetylmuramoyl-tripeptide--D-alanyl-D- alanine ligase n=1 Tax=Leptolyngbya sp. FACHB-541 TaxID=2692810 RepID=UPI001686158A|nr:UDP-N-acetylmuramoyl-tripeptide--D-alanyl-D-alanine ligase [Leptolyngbya sp. FACHB-541]MBD1998407.1 UDP-N-acetylmuramoyl-tripeptide--D-alanyl-D-alanine ligase [Leptolyngbya sp. FACHB-541]